MRWVSRALLARRNSSIGPLVAFGKGLEAFCNLRLAGGDCGPHRFTLEGAKPSAGVAAEGGYAGSFEARTSAVSSRGALANSSSAEAISAAAIGPCRCA